MYDILTYEQMVQLNVGETIRRNFLLCLLKMYEEAVEDYNNQKQKEDLEF
jgi:hypothetical protein